MALIVEYETGVVVELEYGVSEFRLRIVRRKQHEPAAHPQVNEQCAAVIEINQDVLPAAVHEVHQRAGKALGEQGRRDVRSQTFTPQLGGSYRPPGDAFAQIAGDSFDFG